GIEIDEVRVSAVGEFRGDAVAAVVLVEIEGVGAHDIFLPGGRIGQVAVVGIVLGEGAEIIGAADGRAGLGGGRRIHGRIEVVGPEPGIPGGNRIEVIGQIIRAVLAIPDDVSGNHATDTAVRVVGNAITVRAINGITVIGPAEDWRMLGDGVCAFGIIL